MRLNIAPNRLISDIQKEFTHAFPFLKLEFFNNKLFARKDFSIKQMLSHDLKIGNSQSAITDGYIEISEEMKVIDLEKIFKEQFSLAVQVFRKSGRIWLETTITGSWTLQQQNNHGKELSTEKNKGLTKNGYNINMDSN